MDRGGEGNADQMIGGAIEGHAVAAALAGFGETDSPKINVQRKLAASRPGHVRVGRREPNVRVWTPRWMQEVFEGMVARDQVLPCVRPVDAAIITAAGLYGDRGSGPDRKCALEAPGHFTGFPDPVF